MTRQRKAPTSGAEQNDPRRQVHDAPRVIEANVESDVTELTTAEQEVAALLRIAGWHVDDVADVTDEEAALIERAAESEPVPAGELARVREAVLRRRFGTADTSHADENASVLADMPPTKGSNRNGAGRAHRTPESTSAASPEGRSSGADPAVQAHQRDTGAVDAAVAPKVLTAPRPSISRQCKTLKRKIGDVARVLRLDGETLFELDRGGVRSVPARLVHAAAEALGMTPGDVTRCFAPASGDVLPMAAHGRHSAKGASAVAPRDFLEMIESSRLPEEEKQYWRDIIAADLKTSTIAHLRKGNA